MNKRYINVELICNKDPEKFVKLVVESLNEYQVDNHFVEVQYDNDGEYFTALLLQYENLM